MVQSLNTKIDLTVKATAFTGLSEYGNIMIGDKAFEFYHRRDPRKYIQIPWDEVDYVIASVLFGGRWIPRYSIQTKKDGTFTFASEDPKKTLKAIRVYIEGQKMVRSLGFFDVLKRAFIRKKKKTQ
ncbi:hypothetical protein B5S43_03400 [Gilliamella apicola]|uniref:DUF956 family protein n=2 Tax=Gilliamella apicola TaxID=1196095 RepID=A0A1B9JKY2_9GAMM|nr:MULTISPECIES: DUF956 family protein [Gilliamella]KES19734.1 hypothetical protein GASC598B02_018200 [Gilliamella apicola SCGC AB-598-B02]MBI0028935.1 DUF956 family protein [Gilliamella sp. B14448G7]MBI0030410.1 DUF956 family protein [Gilliamella sp. B14384G15]MBI0036056.1 DUF956 family protein [Gilliamella sp. B14448G11]MBI0043053.1 DUF956 family protein [Gilliamella sp. B14448G12]